MVNEEVGKWEETGEAENDLDENEPRFVAIGYFLAIMLKVGY